MAAVTEDDDWADDDEMGVAAAFVLAFLAAGVATAVVCAAIVWNVAAVAADAVHAVRRHSTACHPKHKLPTNSR